MNEANIDNLTFESSKVQSYLDNMLKKYVNKFLIIFATCLLFLMS